ncbi:MAG: AI-2E family transporter, partial [Clostridiales bacterium]|nr:AI-2E family transporter [Clostridiales bacterium]
TFVIFILALQQFDGNILGPKILGDSTGLSSFWVLFAILLFGGLFGFVGMIVGVPIFAVICSLADYLRTGQLKKRHLSTDEEDYMNLKQVDQQPDGSRVYTKMKDPTRK